MHTVKLTPHEVQKVVAFMHDACGNEFDDKRALVASKMSMLCTQLGYRHFYQLWDDVEGSGIASARARRQVVDTLTTSYSYFYRENAHFRRLAELIAQGSVPTEGSMLRVWSAGCATGEEPYNIAMVIEDALWAHTASFGYQIVGSDVSSTAIQAARRARYDAENVARMPPQWRARYCSRVGPVYEVRDTLRNHVRLQRENVLAPRLGAPFDVVMCRNMMIYFNKESIDLLRTVLLSKVKPGGYLFLGHAEILDELEGFTYLEPSLWQRDANAEDTLLGSLANLL